MNESSPPSQNRERALKSAFDHERARLLALAQDDLPQGDYPHPAFGEGSLFPLALLIGEAPGKEEAACGKPFVGRAGRQLDALLAAAGIDRREAYITNAVKYRPVLRSVRSVRNRAPGPKELAAALPLLHLELDVLRPTVIVTLGNTPLKAVSALSNSLKAQGRGDGARIGAQSTVGALHGKSLAVCFGDWSAELFPLYHPASGIYNRALVPVMERDMRVLGEHLVNLRQRTFFDESGMIYSCQT